MLQKRTEVLAYLGIGSNQGERAQHLWKCAEALQRRDVVLRRASRVYVSQYVGPAPPQAAYLNAVLEVTTEVDLWSLLAVTQEVERLAGRRPDTHLQPRPLDVDILFYGDRTSRDRRLQLPHPRLAERRFVLEPLADLGVLQDLPVAGLLQRLELLRQQQDVMLYGEWESLEEKRGLRV